MDDRGSAPFAEFLDFKLLRLLFLVHRRGVVASFAGSAYQSNDISHS